MVGLGIKTGQRLREVRFLNPYFFIPLGTLYRFSYQQLEVRVLCVLNLELENAKSEKYITQNGTFFVTSLVLFTQKLSLGTFVEA